MQENGLVTIDLGDGSVADTRRIFDGINRIYGDILNHEGREGHEVLIADPPSRKATAGQVYAGLADSFLLWQRPSTSFASLIQWLPPKAILLIQWPGPVTG